MQCVLIANRGEIAVRIIGALRELNIKSALVVSDPDRESLAADMADIVLPIGGQTALESYLDVNKILQAAKQVGADGIHPGYGFLSEKVELVEACEKAGIKFIGPSKAAIEIMGDKIKSRQLMISGDVPVVPGFELNESGGAADILEEARKIGFPLMVKAASGGGGKGMRTVRDEQGLMSAIESCQREAGSSFSDSRVFVEKLIENPRHIEIQVFGDSKGNIVHLNERECSIQRRHQKVIEEAPASFDLRDLRSEMGEVAIKAAKLVDYEGAGTVEFIYSSSGDFYFLEMNTRLQVEHPVTELTHGVDLVKTQIRVACGDPLPWNQADLKSKGHALEVRLYAEDPLQNFMPNPGTIVKLKWPLERDWLRLDIGVKEYSKVSPFYDPMIAKLIVLADTRQQAIERMIGVLGELQIFGVITNQSFLIKILSQDKFQSGEIHTSFIEDMKLEQSLRSKLENTLEAFFSLAPALHARNASLADDHAFKVGGYE